MSKTRVEFDIVSTDKGGTLQRRRKEVDALGASYEKTSKAQRAAAAAAAEHDYKQSQGIRGTASAGRNMSKLAQTIDGPNGLVQAYATLAANAFAVSAAFTALREAKQTEIVLRGLEVQGARTGQTLTLVAESLQEISKGGLSSTQAMQVTALGKAAGFTRQDLESLVQVANDASAALGRNLPDSIDRIIKGVTKLEPELLDELGIMTKLGEAQDRYAKELNKSSASLTSFEKRQAMLNAVVTEGTLKYDGLTEAIGGNPYDQIAASFDRLVKAITGGINSFLEFTGVLGVLGENLYALGGATVLFGSAIIPQLLGGFDSIAERATKAAGGFKKIAEAQREQTEEALKSANANRTAAKEAIKGIGSAERIPAKFKTLLPDIKGGDIEATQKGIVSLNRSLGQYNSDLKKIEEDRKKSKKALTDEQQARKAEITGIVSNLQARKEALQAALDAERVYTAQESKLRVERIRESKALTQQTQAEASANAFVAASSFQLPTAFKNVGESVTAYKETLKLAREEKIQMARDTGATIPVMGKFESTMEKAKVGSFALAQGLKVVGTTVLAAIPYIGLAITAFGILQELYDKYFRTEAEREKIKAYKELNTVIDSTNDKIKELQKLTEAEGNAGKRAIQAVKLRSNALNELVESYTKANEAALAAAKAEEQVDKQLQKSLTRRANTTAQVLADIGTANMALMAGAPVPTLDESILAADLAKAKKYKISLESVQGDLGALISRLRGGSLEEEQSLFGTMEKIRSLAPDVGTELLKAAQSAETFVEVQLLVAQYGEKATRIYGPLASSVESFTAASEVASTAQKDLIKAISAQTQYDAAYQGFEGLSASIATLNYELTRTPKNVQQLENLGNILSTLPPEILNLLDESTKKRLKDLEVQNSIVDSLKNELQILNEQGASKDQISAKTTEINNATSTLLSTSKQLSQSVMERVDAYAEELHNARLLSIQGQAQITLAQARLALMQRQGTLTAEDVRRQMEAEDNIVRAQANQLRFNKMVLDQQVAITKSKLQDLRVEFQKAELANQAMNRGTEQLKQMAVANARAEQAYLLAKRTAALAPGAGISFTESDASRLRILEQVVTNQEVFNKSLDMEIKKRNDLFEAQKRTFLQSEKGLMRQMEIDQAQANNVGAQIEAILTRITSETEKSVAETRKTIENNAENNSLLAEAATLAEQNRISALGLNNLLAGRTNTLVEELQTLRAQFEQRKRDIILQRAASIAQLENEKRLAQEAGRSSAVAELETRIRLQTQLANEELESIRLTTLRELAQKALNVSITDGIERQQESLEVIRKQIELTSNLISQEKEIALTRARISAKRLGTELSPEAQQAIEFAAAKKELALARQTFSFRMQAIDAEYDLLEAQRMATAANLRVQVLLLEEFYRVSGGATPEQLNSLSMIKNAADTFASKTYAAARELAKAQERNNLTLAELRAEELSIFGGDASSLASRMISASKQAAEVYRNIMSGANDRVISPMEQAVSVIRPDLNNLQKSLDVNVKDMSEQLTGTIQALGTLTVSVENLSKIGQMIAKAPRSGEQVMTEIAKPQGRITSGFGMREHPILGGRRMHTGIDIAGRRGDPVSSTMQGEVSFAGEMNGYGKVVKVINSYVENGVKKTAETLYAHMSEILVREGQKIDIGTQLGKVGSTGRSTGPHLHYEVRVNGKPVDPEKTIPIKIATEQAAVATAPLTARASEVSSAISAVEGPVLSPKVDAETAIVTLQDEFIKPLQLELLSLEIPLGNMQLREFADGLSQTSTKVGAFATAAKVQFAPLIEELNKLGPEGELVASISSGMLRILDTVTSNTQVISEQLTLVAQETTSSGDKFRAYASIAAASLSTVAGMLGTIASIAKASSDAKISAIDKEIAAEQKRDGKSATSVAKLDALEKKKDQIAKKAFNTNKKLMLAQAVMSTAAGVAGALAIKSPYEFPIAAVTAGIIAAMGAAQIAIIAGSSYQSSYTPQTGSMPSSLSIGKRGESVNLAGGPSQIAGGEVGYLRGARGTGTSATDYRTVGSAYGGELMRGYGNRGFVVGEKGPEVITPETPLTVTPADQVAAQQPINATINIQALDSSDVKRVLVDNRGNIIQMLREAANSSGQGFLEDVNVNVYTRPQVGKL